MLDRFIFIGTGGSGGRTLRFLQSELRQRLGAYGWHDGLPNAWQFLHIDVPARPDVGDAGDGRQIQYLGLTIGGEEYRKFDQQVACRGGAALRHYTGWRADPTRLPIDPDHGAGQYRAAGRVIASATVERLVLKLREVVHAALNADSEDLSRLSAAIGDNAIGSGRVWTILVSSLGGGSGAGIYLDVCDVLRMLDGVGIDSTIALLYTPDIFEEIPTQAKRSLDPNTLAALSELIAATWNQDPPEPGEFSLITTPDVVVPATETFRGPRRSFVISRTNGKVTLKTQKDVYRAVAAALGALVTGPHLQDQLSASTTGDWDAFGRPTDASGMTEGETQPFSSIGYASLSLGRHRFAAYAGNRLAGELGSHLLFGHRPVETDSSDAVILNDLSQSYRDIFLREAGLMEFGPTNNQILDALRGGDFRAVSEPLAAGEKSVLLGSVIGGSREVERDSVRASLTSSLQNRKGAFVEEQQTARERNAAKWVTQVQTDIFVAINRSLVLNGGKGTVAVLESAARHLRNEVVIGLRDEAATVRRQAQSRGADKIDAIFAGAAKKLMADDSRLKQVLEGALSRWIGESEDALTSLAADLVVDLLHDLLEPLIRSLKRSLAELESDWQGKPGDPSPLPRWASGVVGDDLLPADFEVLLEDPATWPLTYKSLLQKQTNKSYIDEARRSIIASVFSSSGLWVKIESPWAPLGAILSTESGQSTARVQFKLRLSSLRECAREQFESPGSEIQRYVREPLSEWLAPENELDENRQRAFLAALTDVQQKARPLIKLNAHIAATMFGGIRTDEYTRLVTPIPLDQSHPAVPGIRRLLSEEFQFTDIELDAAFKADSDTPGLDILSTLQGPVSPLVMTSLTAPLASAFEAHAQHLGPEQAVGDDFWFGRRARPLMASLPVPPHLRRALLRGWMTGRTLGLIDVSDLRRPTIWNGDKWLTFSTLLGRQPVHPRHVLPAVLEGLQLALVRRPIDESVWTPYASLARLGMWTRDDRFQSQASEPLVRWLSTGETGCGAPPNSQLSGSNRDERTKALNGWLNTTLEAYEKLDAQVLTPAWQPIDPAWEIAAPVIRALGQVQAWVIELGAGSEGPED